MYEARGHKSVKEFARERKEQWRETVTAWSFAVVLPPLPDASLTRSFLKERRVYALPISQSSQQVVLLLYDFLSPSSSPEAHRLPLNDLSACKRESSPLEPNQVHKDIAFPGSSDETQIADLTRMPLQFLLIDDSKRDKSCRHLSLSTLPLCLCRVPPSLSHTLFVTEICLPRPSRLIRTQTRRLTLVARFNTNDILRIYAFSRASYTPRTAPAAFRNRQTASNERIEANAAIDSLTESPSHLTTRDKETRVPPQTANQRQRTPVEASLYLPPPDGRWHLQVMLARAASPLVNISGGCCAPGCAWAQLAEEDKEDEEDEEDEQVLTTRRTLHVRHVPRSRREHETRSRSQPSPFTISRILIPCELGRLTLPLLSASRSQTDILTWPLASKRFPLASHTWPPFLRPQSTSLSRRANSQRPAVHFRLQRSSSKLLHSSFIGRLSVLFFFFLLFSVSSSLAWWCARNSNTSQRSNQASSAQAAQQQQPIVSLQNFLSSPPTLGTTHSATPAPIPLYRVRPVLAQGRFWARVLPPPLPSLPN
ncbi:uncharacterized protein SPSK_03175 [Sporothrix schenckii 1099-18]|uniref:Uncharacterized protein n=1 Tax=Sporothrix schenckii 1099-18 TaxID=1397361 RepID=A0A0F2M1R2_SPOSC|nr:uncharacterized protein SPSK_03175 [Sporothrix schenckii 1099-18]KJR82700.1 hypothetical protein SPSK_03175 [Sporothrix schenckii 1099-18]